MFRFSLLSWDQGHLVKVLPCRFNVFRCQVCTKDFAQKKRLILRIAYMSFFCRDALQVQVASNQLFPSLPQLPVWGRSGNSSLLWKPKTLKNNFWMASIGAHKKQRKVLIVISSCPLPVLPVWGRSGNSSLLWKPRTLKYNFWMASMEAHKKQRKVLFVISSCSLPQLPVWGRSGNSSFLWKPRTLNYNFWMAYMEAHKRQRKVLFVTSSCSLLVLPVWGRSGNSSLLWKPRSLNKNLSSASWKVNKNQQKVPFCIHLLYLFIFDLDHILMSRVIDYSNRHWPPWQLCIYRCEYWGPV